MDGQAGDCGTEPNDDEYHLLVGMNKEKVVAPKVDAKKTPEKKTGEVMLRFHASISDMKEAIESMAAKAVQEAKMRKTN